MEPNSQSHAPNTPEDFKARADKINSYPDRDSEAHDAERQQLLDDMLAAGHTPKAKDLDEVIVGLEKAGGFTYDMNTGEAKTVGFAVSIAGHEKPVFIDGLDAKQRRDELDMYISEHAEALSESGNHLGGWVSPDGLLVLDISRVTIDVKEARCNAAEAGQEAFYDFQAQSDVVIRKGAVQERIDQGKH